MFNCFNTRLVTLLFWVLFAFSPASLAEIQSESAFTPDILLHNAVRAGIVEDVKILIEKGANVNQPAKDGVTPLHVAIINNQEEIAELLIKAGAKTEMVDNTTQATPLHMAALYGRDSLTTLLLKQGAAVDATMKFGITPLLVAAEFHQPQIIKLLLDKKADINHADQEGFTALHFAAQNGDEITVKMLLDAGANINARDKTNQATPLSVAVDNNHPGVAKLLKEKGAN